MTDDRQDGTGPGDTRPYGDDELGSRADASDTLPIPPMEQADAAPARRPRRGLVIGAIVAASVLVLAVAVVVTDVWLRGASEWQVAAQIEQELPEGVSGDVDVTIGGASMLLQLWLGRFERVAISAPELDVNGAVLDVDVVLEGTPRDRAQPTDHAEATIALSEAAVSELIPIPGVGDGLRFEDGRVAYTGTIEILGFPIEYRADATIEADGDTVRITPESVRIVGGSAEFELGGIAEDLLRIDPIPVCVAQFLPEGAEVSDLAWEGGVVTVVLEADDLVLDETLLERTGSCG
ncbi:LmeA family phospholipid-binding protein [Agromyces sp. SYSU T00194]|uniref:LmeA family phospholipid-binding protein n=1 Tax=Agromyces chitinivorans TaxID=3158560 RepID=UPI003397DC8B